MAAGLPKIETFSLQAFQASLIPFHLPMDKWKKPVTKLFEEVQNEECALEIKLHRKVEVVCVRCFYTNAQKQRFRLYELKQVFANGEVRERGFKYVSEKMKGGETPQVAAIRALSEELVIKETDVRADIPIEAIPEENEFKTSESPTYPGILSSYNIYYFKAEIPEKHYKETYIEEEADKKTYFTWEKLNANS